LLEPLNHAETALRTRAERAVDAALEGSCQVPLAVYCVVEGNDLSVTGLVGTPDGATVLRSERHGAAADADTVAAAAASDLIGQGAGDIIARLGQAD
jgi:hydroxymethylbilane synthase